MCSEEEFVLSDVHINADCSNIVHPDKQLLNPLPPGLRVVQSRFEFRMQDKSFHVQRNAEQSRSTFVTKPGTKQAYMCARNSEFDEDGDLVYQKTSQESKEVLIIDHFMETPLSLVGLQVWQGSFLLADYFLHMGSKMLKNCVALELGAGTGLCSLIAAMFAETVFATDYDETVLNVCQRNVSNNRHLLNAKVKVKKLEWRNGIDMQPSIGKNWSWDSEEKSSLSNVQIVFAADVIYRDDLTDDLFNIVEELLAQDMQVFYLALEKRLNFSLEELDVSCSAYNYFRRSLSRFKAQQVETTFPKSFNYIRIPQLELWIIQRNEKSVIPTQSF